MRNALAAALVLAGALAVPAGADAAPVVYCAHPGVSGTAYFTGGAPDNTMEPRAYRLWVQANCGAFDQPYTFDLEGVAREIALTDGETCGAGHSNGDMKVLLPDGRWVTGQFSFDRFGIHYYVDGSYVVDGRTIQMLLWLDVWEIALCQESTPAGGIIGHGAILRDAGGLGCRLVKLRGESGEVVGLVSGGPWVVPGAESVTVECAVAVGSPGGPGPVRTSTMTGPVGVLAPEVVRFPASPGTDVWICSDVTWRYPAAPDGGYQACELATGVEM